MSAQSKNKSASYAKSKSARKPQRPNASRVQSQTKNTRLKSVRNVPNVTKSMRI